MSQGTISTKDQERAAIKKIANILNGLGENSYVATALEGCLEIAEYNIENDFADSYKNKYETAERKYNETLEERKSYATELLEKERQINELKEKISAGWTENDKIAIQNILIEAYNRLGEDIANSERAIINYADNPLSEEFKTAVEEHRKANAKRDKLSDILTRA